MPAAGVVYDQQDLCTKKGWLQTEQFYINKIINIIWTASRSFEGDFPIHTWEKINFQITNVTTKNIQILPSSKKEFHCSLNETLNPVDVDRCLPRPVLCISCGSRGTSPRELVESRSTAKADFRWGTGLGGDIPVWHLLCCHCDWALSFRTAS